MKYNHNMHKRTKSAGTAIELAVHIHNNGQELNARSILALASLIKNKRSE